MRRHSCEPAVGIYFVQMHVVKLHSMPLTSSITNVWNAFFYLALIVHTCWHKELSSKMLWPLSNDWQRQRMSWGHNIHDVWPFQEIQEDNEIYWDQLPTILKQSWTRKIGWHTGLGCHNLSIL